MEKAIHDNPSEFIILLCIIAAIVFIVAVADKVIRKLFGNGSRYDTAFKKCKRHSIRDCPSCFGSNRD